MLRKTITLFSLGLAALASSNANAGPAYNYVPTTQINGGGTQTLGFDFKVNSPITITALGIYQGAGASSIVGQTVYLYDLTTSTLLASRVISGPTTPDTFDYNGGTINLTLNTSDTYSEYSLFQASNTQYEVANSIVFDPSVKNVLIQGQNTGYNTTGGTFPPALGYANILAVNFQFASAVPEPASVTMMGLGLAGVVLFRRKLIRRAA